MTPDDIAHLLALSDAVEERIGPEAAELVRRAAGDLEFLIGPASHGQRIGWFRARAERMEAQAAGL